MKQIVFLHGGETFASYEDYLAALETYKYTYPLPEEPKRWKYQLRDELTYHGWEVHMPSMPSKFNARYDAWRLWFRKVVPHLRDGVVLVGHSLGGLFLIKYLEEERLPATVDATHIIAAPYDTVGPGESLADFTIPSSLDHVVAQAGTIMLYHSEDDSIVPFAEVLRYQAALPQAALHTFTDRGHFLGPTFPELTEAILCPPSKGAV
jgi:uncharacterized protein